MASLVPIRSLYLSVRNVHWSALKTLKCCEKILETSWEAPAKTNQTCLTLRSASRHDIEKSKRLKICAQLANIIRGKSKDVSHDSVFLFISAMIKHLLCFIMFFFSFLFRSSFERVDRTVPPYHNYMSMWLYTHDSYSHVHLILYITHLAGEIMQLTVDFI